MIQIYIRQLLILIKRLFVCYLAYFICRLGYFYANSSYFPNSNTIDLLRNCFYGLRFDSFSIVVSNSLFILLSILPINAFFHNRYQAFLKWTYFITNAIFLLANLIDTGYFPFIHKRSTYDLFEQLGGQSDLVKLLPQFMKDFWWIVLIFILLMALMVFLYKKIRINENNRYSLPGLKQGMLILLLFLLVSGFAVLGARGGFQRIPIDIVNAGAMTKPDEIPIILNTPFTLIKTVGRQALTDYHFYEKEELQAIYNPIHHFKDSTFRKQNVIVLILESFSKEYTALSRGKSFTPFLDSLMGKSLVFTNAFSNGTKSIEGIPAILSSLPSLMDNPFINSVYANNKQTSLATLLKNEGYETAFFHGGINGTMNFTDWATSGGYNKYFGKNEYNNDEDFDNFWGIWDEPFLQYAVNKMSSFTQPFHSAIFTLSSHHPYFVPEKYKNKFPKGKLENTESIEYADYALKQFFKAAQKTAWYHNTLFVLTADHASISEDPFYSNVVGNQSIPVLFFRPDNSLTGQNKHTFSQMDILPSTLDLLGYNKPFFAFGESYLRAKNPLAYYYGGGNYFVYNDSTVFYINNNRLNNVHNYKRDSTLTQGILNNYPRLDSTVFTRFKAFIQTYNYRLIHNPGDGE